MKKLLKEPCQVKGVVTVEMSFIVPLVMAVIVATIYVTFYMHDKCILNGIAYETAMLGTQKMRTPKGVQEQELKTYMQEKIGQKLILLTTTEMKISIEEEQVQVSIKAQKGKMSVHIKQQATNVRPEMYIRNINKVKELKKE